MENARLRRAASDLTLEKPTIKGTASDNFLGPARHRAYVDHVTAKYGVSERLVRRVLGQNRPPIPTSPSGWKMKRL